MLQIERNDKVEIWTIARLEARNALNAEVMLALQEAISRAAHDTQLRAIVLTGEGNCFVSGGDLRELRHFTLPEDAAALADNGRRICEGLEQLPMPVIAAIGGPAFGGGAELAIACDMRVADESARICFKQGRLGVTTAWGTFPKLCALVGPSRAAYMLYTGHELTAQSSFSFGLVDTVVESGNAVMTALAWALDIAGAAPLAISEMKALFRDQAFAYAELRARERERFIRTWSSDDHREAVEAYFERRVPVFRGR